jgi:hypothetical protein
MEPRAYALILLAVLAIGCAVDVGGEILLYRAGETLAPGVLIERQSANGGLYFGLAMPVGEYKLAAYALRKPDILILGSSRAHREHQEFYNRSSYSMSGLVASPADAFPLLDLLIPIHKPDIVILNLDFFSFCSTEPPARTVPQVRPSGRPSGPGWNRTNRFALVPKLVGNGTLSPQDVSDLVLGRTKDAPDGTPLFGLIAISQHMGFRLDGAVAEIDPREQGPEDFERAQREVRTGTRHYIAGCSYDPAVAANLEMLQQELDHEGIKLVVLMPPVPPTIFHLFMAAPKSISGYYATALRELAKEHLPDLHILVDGAMVGAQDSEFADAVHGGDVSEARMLLKAAEQPGTMLAGIINRPFLERLVRERSGALTVGISYLRAADAAASK